MTKTTSKAKKTVRGTKSTVKSSKSGMTKKKTASTRKKKITIEENPLASRRSSVYSQVQPIRQAPPPQPHRQKTGPRMDKVQQRKQVPRPQTRKPRRRRNPVSFATFVLLLIICGGVAMGVHLKKNYRAFAEMKQVVSQQTFYPGTLVDDIDLSQMTLQQAISYWEEQIEPAYRDSTVTLDDGTSVTASRLGYQSDYQQTLSSAWSAGRSGSLAERYIRMTQGSGQGASYTVNRSLYDEAIVAEYAASVAQQVDTQAQDAQLISFNTQTYSFEFEPEVQGRSLNQEKLVQDIEAALQAGGGSVQMQIDVIA